MSEVDVHFPEAESTTSVRARSLVTRAVPADQDAAILVRGVNHWYGTGENRRQVLVDNHLALARGEVVVMTGPSGSGKTTLLTIIGALRTVQNGSLRVLGQEMNGLDPAGMQRMRRNIGFIFQAHNLFKSLTAMQNVKLALELHDPSARHEERAAEMLAAVGLEERMHYKPEKLSGGQMQRVAIARALAPRPRLILADEPTAALDAKNGGRTIRLFKVLAREQGVTVLLVTHDERVLQAADRVVRLEDGKIVSDVFVRAAEEVCAFLVKCPLFAELKPETLARVADRILQEKVRAGEVLIRQGEKGDRFYVVRSGQVEVTVKDAAGTRTVARLGAGEYFGEAALVSGAPRNATVTTVDECELYVLEKSDFDEVRDASGTFRDELTRVITLRR